ncbi:MAG TPA: nucleotidyl transferase AbiEii/AbiGii toxin family protein [Acidimicrobiales bacterium]|nr:nucleotidyl transferase AbiEii/AbiGii toxin family protein [Acidimicrobiales bacterium]
MTAFERAARTTAGHLERLEAPYALVGGFAVSVRCEPRFTRDVDLVVAVQDDQAAEAIVRALTSWDYRLLAVVEQEAAGRLATARLAFGADGEAVDLLFASSGIEPEIAAAAEQLEILPGLVLPVARTGHLIALKLLAADPISRPQDAVDLRALLDAAGPEDVEVARRAVGLIEARGFQRGRDLEAALDDLLSR